MVHPPERREEAGRIVGEILEGKTEYCPVPVITKEGIQIPVETRVSHGFWDGRPVIFGITKDISQVRLSEEKYAKLFYNNHSACGLSEFETGRYFEVNDAFYNLFGFTSEEVIGKSALDLGILTPESSNDLISKVGEKDKIKNIEFNLIAKNGDIKHVLISGENIYIQNKKFRYTIVNDITERKKAEELLRESEVKYKTLFENTGTAIIIIEEDTTISLANEEFASRTGYLRAEVEGVKKWTDIVAQEDIAWMLARHQMRRENPDDTTPVYEFRYRTKSGELKYALINVQLIPGTKKSMASLIDITDRKQAEIALKDSETKLRGILNNSRDAIGVHINGICEICNPAALQLFGVSSPDDLIGKPILNVVAPRERKRIQDFVTKRTSEINAPTEYITRGLRSDGSEFDMDVILSTFKLENIIHVLVILRDITELKKAEEALRESEARFRNMADTAPVLIWVSGPDSLCTYVNKPWLDFTGRKLEQEVGNGWVEDLYPADYKNSHLLYHKAFKAHNAYTMEYRLRRADGSYRWMLENGVPRFTSDGTFVGYIGSCTDITENKQAQEELNLLNAELEKRVKQRTLQLENSYKELEAFSYAVAHNLRSPLRGIDGWSLALLEDYDQILDEQGHYYLTLVRSEAQLMGNLIDDLLRLTHTTSIEIQKVDLDLTNLVKKVVAQVTKNYPKRKFEFEIESGLIIHADPSLLEIALASLIDNACKFTGLESIARIELGKVEVDGKSNFFIRDNGVGFNMEYTKKIFGAFQRMHKPADFPGAGIGLAIVHLIITRHGGNIWVESKPDEGATFYFTVSNEG